MFYFPKHSIFNYQAKGSGYLSLKKTRWRSILCIQLIFRKISSRKRDITVNSLPNHILLDWSKLKAFADDKIYMTNTEILFEMGRKHCRKGRNCWLPAFSPFSTKFSKGFFLRSLKVRIELNVLWGFPNLTVRVPCLKVNKLLKSEVIIYYSAKRWYGNTWKLSLATPKLTRGPWLPWIAHFSHFFPQNEFNLFGSYCSN